MSASARVPAVLDPVVSLVTEPEDAAELDGIARYLQELLRTGEAPNPATRLKEFERAAVDLPPDLRRRIRSILGWASRP